MLKNKFAIQRFIFDFQEKKKEIWPSPMTKPLYQQKIWKPKDNTHKRHQKLRLHNDCGPT